MKFPCLGCLKSTTTKNKKQNKLVFANVNDDFTDSYHHPIPSHYGNCVAPVGGREGRVIKTKITEDVLKAIRKNNPEKISSDANTITLNSAAITDNLCFSGEFREGNACGVCTLEWKDGEKYKGEIKDGYANGMGIWSDGKGISIEGTFVYGKVNGPCILTGTLGSKYEGNMVDDRKDGKATEKWQDGVIYVGEFVNGVRTGQAIIKFVSGDNYRGNVKDTELNGSGKYTWANGTKYEGEFLRGRLHGKGRFILCDNSIEYLEGTFVRNTLHGKGVMKTTAGAIYEGNFTDGQLSGTVRVGKDSLTLLGMAQNGTIIYNTDKKKLPTLKCNRTLNFSLSKEINEANRSKINESAQSKTNESTQSKTNESAQSKTNESTQSKTNESTQSKTTGSTPPKANESTQSKTTGSTPPKTTGSTNSITGVEQEEQQDVTDPPQ